ncbi:RnfABCDGE type electron transport complex subunit D [Thiothrix subterranea]|uniref:RnfABCDGE type electron transport complex subunit D n=1 Tax=Thiothrix subterranea TaxID=2735563 RepID=UPI0035AB8B23
MHRRCFICLAGQQCWAHFSLLLTRYPPVPPPPVNCFTRGDWAIYLHYSYLGGYPDAIAFSVIIMNMAVPLLDYYTQPRVYGTKRGLQR